MTLQEVLEGASCDPADVWILEAPEVREWNEGCEDNSEVTAPVLEDIYRERLLGESIDSCRCRASLFLGRLVRDLPRYPPTKILVVTHGIWSLCFVARFFHLTDEEFLTLKNIGNGEYVEIAPTRLLADYEFEWRGWGVRGIGRRD